MDLVVGAQGTKPCLLTLTERMLRKEVIIWLPDRRAVTIRRAIERLGQNTTGFRQKFKSITTDNGKEFLEYELLIRNCRSKGKRFAICYCVSVIRIARLLRMDEAVPARALPAITSPLESSSGS